MTPFFTDRLTIRELDENDATFLLELLNEPAFIANIADRGVRTVDDALAYLRDGPQAMIAKHGFGLWRVSLNRGDKPIGICGILKRDSLPDPDLGYALLARQCGHGYAIEAAAATLDIARSTFGCDRVLAITSLENAASIRVLEKLDFRFEEIRQLPGVSKQSRVFVSDCKRSKTAVHTP
ncbi:MAG: GNAT family N-acetyltransferase [Dokdonella sp.]